MSVDGEQDGNNATALSDRDLDGLFDDEEWPEEAVACPLSDTPWHLGEECVLCQGREWVLEETIEAYLGPNRLPCLYCAGEGWSEGLGPITWTCDSCLGTGQMP